MCLNSVLKKPNFVTQIIREGQRLLQLPEFHLKLWFSHGQGSGFKDLKYRPLLAFKHFMFLGKFWPLCSLSLSLCLCVSVSVCLSIDFNWSIVDLQCRVSFRCSALNISILFQILFPYGLLQNTEWSSLCYAVGPCWLSILYTVVCIC